MIALCSNVQVVVTIMHARISRLQYVRSMRNTLLLNEGIPRAYWGKNFVWKIYWNFPLNLRVLPADSDGSICKKWMQNALRFVMKNRSFSSLKNNFKIRIKSYLSKRKNFYFSSEIWGRFAFTFCRYFHQNLQVLPSESVAGNTLRFRGKKQYIFQTKFFPLKSAFRCPHLTTVRVRTRVLMLLILKKLDRLKPLNITPVLISPLTSYTRVKAASNERHTWA